MDHERAFAAAFGAYTGCLVVPAATWVFVGPLWTVLAAGFAVTTVAAYLAARKADLATSLTGVWRNLALVGLPLVYLPALVFRPPGLSPIEFVATPAAVGLLGLLPGLVAVVAGDVYRNRRAFEEATVHVKFEARPGPRARRMKLLAVGFVVFGGVFGALVMLFAGGDLNSGTFVTYVAGVMGSLAPIFAGNGDEREVAVTDAGVKVQMQVHDWDTFADYDVTDDALVLERPGRFRSSFKFDREDVERLDEVETTLKRYLPRE
ncbi:hypothetical protein [Halorussus ruber]|uniref:hypothetical protein n=1 Tax=Halorussus ruber TaxID=1126238 RepID=UPI001091B7DF|nr:hypothetical protein [Halorussus ruber]